MEKQDFFSEKETEQKTTNQNLIKPRKKSYWWIWLIVIVLLIIGIFIYRNATKTVESPFITEVAAKQDIVQSVEVTGTIEPAAEIDLNFKSVGTIESVNIIVGDKVTKGQTLATLDTSELKSQLNQARANVAVAQAQLQQVQEGAKPEEINIQETNVKNAQTTYDSAIKNYGLTQKNIDSERQTAQLNLQNAQNQLSDAQTNLANIESQNVQNIKNTIDNNLNQINIVLISEQSIQKNIQEIWSNDTWYTNFKNIGFVPTNNINYYLGQIDIYKNNANSSYQKALVSKTEIDTDQASNDTLVYIQNITSILQNMNSLIYSENTKAFFTPTDLNTLISRQNSNENSNNNNLATMQNISNNLINTKITNQLSIDNAKSQITNYQNQIATSKENITKIETDAISKMQNAQDQIDNAKNQLEIQQKQLTLTKSGATAAAIAVAQAQVNYANTQINTIQTQIDNLSIIAPVSGIITQVNVNPGEQSNSANPIIQMHSDAKFEINSEIAETDIDKIKIGDKSIIDFDAFPNDQKFSGIVSEIDPAATIIQGVVYYQTKVILDSQDPKIKAGMTANIEIITAEKSDVMAVSNQAIKTVDGKKVVEILLDEKTQTTENKNITPGIRGNTHTEITEGLTGGENIIILKK